MWTLFNINNKDWMLPYLMIVLYFCLGMNAEMGSFYDYTILNMYMGMLIG